MADWGTGTSPVPEPAGALGDVPLLALNRLGRFHWDLDRQVLNLDGTALAVFGLRDGAYDQRPATLRALLPPADVRRLRRAVFEALRTGVETYGAYFRVRPRGAAQRWAYASGFIDRDAQGRARRVYGIVRDATDELNEPGRPDAVAERHGRWEVGSVVQSVTAALARAHTVREVIQVLQDAYEMEHLGSASMVLGLVETGHMRIIAAQPAARLVPGSEVSRLDEPYPTNDAVRMLSPLFIESPEEFERAYPDLWDHFDPYGVAAAAYLPLIAQARPIGVLGLQYHDKSAFSDQERNLLIALASNVAQSLQRAMLFEQAKDLAQSLQEAMLPHSIPAVPEADLAVRYRSASLAREVGGDWYDVIPLPQGRYGAVIGDVQGHDTHAAAVMGQLRIVLRAYAAEGHTPATVLTRASGFLHELDTDRFATCLYAEADLSSGVIQIVRAGHLSPLLRRQDGRCVRLDIAGGLPLGHSQEFGSAEYDVTTLRLAPGQTLLLFTDGLVERPGTDLDDGIRALIRQVDAGPHDLDRLADELCGAADERQNQDDLALLLLRRHAQHLERTGMRLRREVAPGDPDALVAARQMVRAAGRTVGLEHRGDELELVADELITNVLIHTEGSATVSVRLLDGTKRRARQLRVEVEDASSALPRRRTAGASGVSGRGLQLVAGLADDWGVEPRGSGKCVWSQFAVP